jgi:hypothetical protein
MKQDSIITDSKKIKKPHGNSTFTVDQESKIAALIKDYLKSKGRPKNIEPIKKIINDFIEKNMDKKKKVSAKKAYEIVKMNRNLRQLYYGEDNETLSDCEESTAENQTVSKEEYNKLKSVVKNLENKVDYYMNLVEELRQQLAEAEEMNKRLQAQSNISYENSIVNSEMQNNSFAIPQEFPSFSYSNIHFGQCQNRYDFALEPTQAINDMEQSTFESDQDFFNLDDNRDELKFERNPSYYCFIHN